GNSRQSMTFPGRWTVVSSVTITRIGPKKGFVMSSPRGRKENLICSGASGSRLNFTCEPRFWPASARHVVLSDAVTQSAAPKDTVTSAPSPGGGTLDSWSFTRIAIPAELENGPGGTTSMKFPEPCMEALAGPAAGKVRAEILVAR